MLEVIRNYFLLFMFYSIMGWFIEVIPKLFIKHKFINRGFFIGPYCPIYGYGSLIMTLLLQKYNDHLLLLFCMSVLICSILEYITSYIMEVIFHARWWDYSHYKFNLNGRICLSNAILFGIGGTFLICVMNFILFYTFKHLSSSVLNVLSITLFIIYIIDNLISFKVMANFRITITKVMQDSTEEMKNEMRKRVGNFSKNMKGRTNQIFTKSKENVLEKFDQIRKEISSKTRNHFITKSKLSNRLMKAFPNFKASLGRGRDKR